VSLGMEISYPVNVWLLGILPAHGCTRRNARFRKIFL